MPEGISVNKSDESQLKISFVSHEEIYVAAIAGELSIFNVAAAREAVFKLTSNHKYNMVFDLHGVNYIDSAGTGFLISVYRDLAAHGGDLKLARLSPFTERFLKGVLNLDFFLSMFESVDDAVADFKSNAACAIYRWQRVLEQQPNYPDAYLNLARIFLKNGLTAEALTETEKALKINPEYADALNMRGQILLKSARYQEAIVNFKKVLEVRPDELEALTWLAICYDDSNMLDEAITRYRDVIEVYPKYADLYYMLGMAYLKKHSYETAIETLKKALEINPGYLDAHRGISTAYMKLRDREMAMRHLQSIASLSIDEREIAEVREISLKLSKDNYPSSYFLGKVI